MLLSWECHAAWQGHILDKWHLWQPLKLHHCLNIIFVLFKKLNDIERIAPEHSTKLRFRSFAIDSIFITMGQWCCSLQGRSRGDFPWALNTVVATRFSCSWSSHFHFTSNRWWIYIFWSISASLTCWFSIIKHFTQAFCTGVTDEWLSPRTSAFLSVITLVPLPLPNTLLHVFRQSFLIEMY